MHDRLAVLAITVAILPTAGPVEAGPLLASAMRHAQEITLDPVATPPTDCEAAAREVPRMPANASGAAAGRSGVHIDGERAVSTIPDAD